MVAAALSGVRFLRCVGVEVLPALHDCAQTVVDDVQRTLAHPTAAANAAAATSYAAHHRVTVAAQSLPAGLPLMDARLGDFLVEDWSDADFAFAASLGFSEQTVEQLMDAAAQRLRPGARLVLLTLPHGFHTALARWDAGQADGCDAPAAHAAGGDHDHGGACFALERAVWCKMTWGRVRAYVLVRTGAPAPLVVSDPIL